MIGRSLEDLRTAIQQSLSGRRFELALSRRSVKKTYCSYNLNLWVQDASQRDAAYQMLKDLPQVMMVL